MARDLAGRRLSLRRSATYHTVAYALIGIEIAGALLGTLWAIRRRKLAPLLMLGGNGIATLYLLSRGSPYANAKVMMIFSLTAVLTGMLGAAALLDYGRRVEAWVLAAAIAGGVLWSNVLGYHDASLAPRNRLTELASIDSRFRGQGPAFFNLSDEFAAYFLRDLAPIDPALGPPIARAGITPPQGRQPWDPNELDPNYLQSLRLLVLGNSPLTSRPPADFQLVYRGRFFNVWRRAPSPRVLAHVPLAGHLFPFSVPRCSLVKSTAAQAIRDHAQARVRTGLGIPDAGTRGRDPPAGLGPGRRRPVQRDPARPARGLVRDRRGDHAGPLPGGRRRGHQPAVRGVRRRPEGWVNRISARTAGTGDHGRARHADRRQTHDRSRASR